MNKKEEFEKWINNTHMLTKQQGTNWWEEGNYEHPYTEGAWEAWKYLNKQFIIDNLMLEYCPDKMTSEQIKEWGKHQVPHKGKTK